MQSLVVFKPEKKKAESYFKKVCLKQQQSFITIRKFQNMYFLPLPKNLYEFLYSIRICYVTKDFMIKILTRYVKNLED